MVGIFDYLNSFWSLNAQKPCSTTEVALYFYLLNEVNHNHWNMPVKCCTELIRIRLKTTKQNIIKVNSSPEVGECEFIVLLTHPIVHALQQLSSISVGTKEMGSWVHLEFGVLICKW